MLTITAQEIAKFTASAELNLNHFKFTKSNIVVILQTLQERSATVKGQRGEEEGEESTEWECIKEHLMITVYTNWTAHVRTGEQKHSTFYGMLMSLFTPQKSLSTYMLCVHQKKPLIVMWHYIYCLQKMSIFIVIWYETFLLLPSLCATLKSADEPLCNSVQFHEIWCFWTQWERLERRQRLIFFMQ